MPDYADSKLNQRFCILIVDDEPVNRRVLLNHLSLRSYRVVEAADGREAIRLLEGEQTFDLVLLDVMMPGLSGYEVCSILRERHGLMDLPVIFLTAKNQVTDLVTAFEVGGNDFLSKPVAKEELLSRVTTHLQLLDTNRNLENKVSERTEELNNRNKHILASINYAERIQAAILPEIEAIGKSLDEFFVLFRPKDIVSGDFYWCYQRDGMFFIAAIDCTGHGVPGAFMSMIGNTLLNQIVRGDGIYDPEQILWNLHGGIVRSLKQEGRLVSAADGMDICLIKIEIQEKRVTFVGAGRPLFRVSSGDVKAESALTVIKGDRNSVGGRRKVHDRVFTNHQFITQPGDMLYLTTDGYVGQPISKRKSYGSQRLREFLTSIAPLPCSEQNKALEAELEAYRQDTPQRDDITVIGIRM